MFNYPVKTEHTAPNETTITVRDLGDHRVISSTLTDELAIHDAEVNLVALALADFVTQRKRIPEATDAEAGEHALNIPAVMLAKIALWNEMMDRNMKKADLYNLLKIAPVLVDRLIDFTYPSKMNSLEEALAQLSVTLRMLPTDRQWISLAQGGFFAQRLVDAYVAAGVTEMPIGKTREGLASVKTYSLDYILRTRYARQPDTMQAVDTVLESLESTGLFRRSLMKDPKTNRDVESIALV